MFKSLSDNLNLLMAKARLNSSELARQTGLPATTIKRIRNNEQSNPTITTLLPIANYFSTTINELIGNEVLQPRQIISHDLKEIPLLSWQECIHFQTLNYEELTAHIHSERTLSDKAFALKVEEELDFFPKNCLLLVEPKITPTSNDYVILTKTGQETAAIKKYILDIDEAFLKSLIPGIGVSSLTPEHKILGVIIQYKMELKHETYRQ